MFRFFLISFPVCFSAMPFSFVISCVVGAVISIVQNEPQFWKKVCWNEKQSISRDSRCKTVYGGHPLS